MKHILIQILVAAIVLILLFLLGGGPHIAKAEAPIWEGSHDPVFEKIADCESQNNPKAKNSHSTASGRFQILDGTWKQWGREYWGDEWVQKDKLDYFDNTELAWYGYKKNGTKPWNPSKPCWNYGKI